MKTPRKISPRFRGRFLEAVTKSVAGKDLTAADFAYVGDPKDPSTWKLPVHDEAHARNALARFDQAQIPAADKKAVAQKVYTAAKKFGIDASGFHSQYLEAADDGFDLDAGLILEEAVVEGTAEKGSVWAVTPVSVGKSSRTQVVGGLKAAYFYSQEAIDKSAPNFEGAQVFAHAAGPHVDPSQKSTLNEVGWLAKARGEPGRMKAELHLLPSARWLRENLVNAFSKGKKDIYELSMHAGGVAYPKEMTVDGKTETVFFVESIDKVDSVDVVPRGAAGGRFDRMIESHQPDLPNKNNSQGAVMNAKQKLLVLFTLLFPAYLAEHNVDWMKVDENEMFTYLVEADKATPMMKLPDGIKLADAKVDDLITRYRAKLTEAADANARATNKLTLDKIDALMAMFESDNKLTGTEKRLKEIELRMSAATLSTKLAESKLPVPLQEAVRAQYKDRSFTEAEIDGAIKVTRETWAKMVPNDPAIRFIEAGQDRMDKMQAGLLGLFMCSNQAVKPLVFGSDEAKLVLGKDAPPPYRSFKEAYIDFTGDTKISGEVKHSARFSESIDTVNFAHILADLMNKRMVRDYGFLGLDQWRPFVDIVPLNSFMTQHRLRYGGYANLPIVTQKAAYQPLASPTDEDATYTPAKRGGLEDLSREAIMNDNVGPITSIPKRLARAAAQTLHEFVFGFITPVTAAATTIYDGTALYVAGHANIGTAALAADAVAFNAALLRMKKQTMLNNAKRLGIRGRYLIVPVDLRAIAYGLVTPAAGLNNAVPAYNQTLGCFPVIVDYWTDATDWCLVSDPADCVGLEMGFINGDELPQLFVSDLPNVGSMFTNDVVTYKIRHEYGGAITDWRAFDGSIVAG